MDDDRAVDVLTAGDGVELSLGRDVDVAVERHRVGGTKRRDDRHVFDRDAPERVDAALTAQRVTRRRQQQKQRNRNDAARRTVGGGAGNETVTGGDARRHGGPRLMRSTV